MTKNLEPAECRTLLARQSGFSIIELLVVVVIVTVLLAAGLPAMQKHTGTSKLIQATDEVSSTLKLARQRAVATSGTVVVQFDKRESRFYLFDDENGNGARDGNETMAGPYNVPKGVALAEVGFANSRVAFGPLGGASESKAVVLVNARADAQRVDVTGATGLIYVSGIYQYEGGDTQAH
jgi:prepilin-type N-terminal cleavage/methylation domain-containing protein